MFEAIKNYGRRYASWTSWGFNAGQETAASLVEFVPFALVTPARVESGMTFVTRVENTYGVTQAHQAHQARQAHQEHQNHVDAADAVAAHDGVEEVPARLRADSVSSRASVSTVGSVATEYGDVPAQVPVDGLLRRMFTWPVRAVSRYVVGGVVGAFTGAIAAVVAIPAAFVADANDVLPAPGYVANHLNEQRGSAVKWAVGVALLAVAGFAGYVALTFGVAALAVAAPIVLPAVAALGLLAGVGKLVFSYTAYAERTAKLNRAEALCKQLAELAQDKDTPVYNMDYKTPAEAADADFAFNVDPAHEDSLAYRQAQVARGDAIRTALPVYINNRYETHAESENQNLHLPDAEVSDRVAEVLAGRAIHTPSLSRIYDVELNEVERRHALQDVPAAPAFVPVPAFAELPAAVVTPEDALPAAPADDAAEDARVAYGDAFRRNLGIRETNQRLAQERLDAMRVGQENVERRNEEARRAHTAAVEARAAVIEANALLQAENDEIDARNAQRQAIRNNTAINTDMDAGVIRASIRAERTRIRATIDTIQSKIAAGEDCSVEMATLNTMQDLGVVRDQVLRSARTEEVSIRVNGVANRLRPLETSSRAQGAQLAQAQAALNTAEGSIDFLQELTYKNGYTQGQKPHQVSHLALTKQMDAQREELAALKVAVEAASASEELAGRVAKLEKLGSNLRDTDYMFNGGKAAHDRYPSLHKQTTFLQSAVVKLAAATGVDLQDNLAPGVADGRITPTRLTKATA